MEILKAILLGFLQGVTEFLPISSSGHLSVFQHFFGNVGGTSSLLFTVLLHMGTLIAVFVVYYKTIWGLIVEFFSTIKDIFTGKFKWSEMNENRRMLFMFVISCVPLLFLLIPVGGDRRIMDVLGGLADDNDILVEGVCFLFTAALLLVGSWRAKKVKARPQIGAKSALAVGVAQAFAAGFPGISRSGSTISTGMICGVSKEYMVRYSFILGIPAILAGILTQLSLYSVNLKIMGKANQAINVDKFNLLVSLRRVKGVVLTQNTLFIVAIMIVILIAVLYWFFGTELGCSLRATGCNPSMSRAQGINTDRNKVLGLMLSNGLVALSSALLAQYQGFADVNMGRGSIVIGLAAVIIGEAIFGRIFRNFALRLLAVIFGSILYYLVLQIVIWMGIDTDLLKMLSAIVVALFLAFPYWKGKYFNKPAKRGGK